MLFFAEPLMSAGVVLTGIITFTIIPGKARFAGLVLIGVGGAWMLQTWASATEYYKCRVPIQTITETLLAFLLAVLIFLLAQRKKFEAATKRAANALLSFIREAWKGREPLWKVFWIYFTLVSPCLIIFLFFVSLEFLDLVCPKPVFVPCFIFYFIVATVIICYGIWVCVATWRCASNAKVPINSILAKFCVIIFASVLAVGTPAMILFLRAATIMRGPK